MQGPKWSVQLLSCPNLQKTKKHCLLLAAESRDEWVMVIIGIIAVIVLGILLIVIKIIILAQATRQLVAQVWLSEADLGLVMRFVNRPEVPR